MSDPGAGRPPVRIVLVDDTADFRLLLRAGLSMVPGLTVVGEAGDGAAAVEVAAATRPDVVLLDLAMPVMDGLAALPLLRAAVPDARVVVLSGFDADRMGDAALAAGASGFVHKGASVRAIAAEVARVAGVEEPAAPPPVPPAATVPGEVERLRHALAAAAHELRSPVTVLTGLTGLMQERRDDLDEATFARMLDAVSRQAQVLERVTRDLLTSAQVERGTVAVQAERTALAPLLQAAVGDTATGLTCSADLEVFADPVRVVQMVGNLLSNAHRYGAPPVRVMARAAGDGVEVRVRDSGPGVPESFRGRMFEQYTRAADAAAGGTGIGLFVVASLARAQGGSVRYETPPGGGACFVVGLPGHRPVAEDAPADRPDPCTGSGTGR